MKLLCARVLALLLALVAAVFHGAHGRNPGLKAKVTEFGLTYGMKVFLSVLKDRAQQIQIPNQSGRADVVIGKVDYQFTNIKMTSFNIGGTSLPVVPREGLRLRANGVSASLNGNWHYSAKVAFIPIRDGGTLSLSIREVSLDVVIRLGKDPQDRPTISVGSCSAHIGDVSVTFHGGASWLYNLFKGAIENTIKKQLDSEICKSVSKAIDEDVEKSFAQIKVLEPVGKFADLDLGLEEAPSFLTNSMDLPLKVSVFQIVLRACSKWSRCAPDSRITVPVSPAPIPDVPETSRMIYTGNISLYPLQGAVVPRDSRITVPVSPGPILEAAVVPRDSRITVPVSPGPIPEVPETSRMIYLYGSEYVGNAIAYIYHKIPKDLPFKLNTTYLAGLVPKVGELYPDMGVELVLNTSLPPHLSIRPGRATLTGYGNVHVYATPQDKPAVYLFSINVTMDLGAEVKLIGELLYGNVSMDPNKIKISTFGSTIGPVPSFGLDFGIRALCEATVPWINNYLAQGIPFRLKDVLFENAQVVMHQGFISIGTDLSMYLSEFRIGHTSMDAEPDAGLRMITSAESSEINGDWGYRMTSGFFLMSDVGRFKVSVSSAYIDVVISMDEDAAEKPTVSVQSCDAGVGGMELVFHGGARNRSTEAERCTCVPENVLRIVTNIAPTMSWDRALQLGLLLVSCVAVMAGNLKTPGVRSTFTQSGLDYGAKVFSRMIQRNVDNIRIPASSGQIASPIGTVEYYTKNMELTDFDMGHSRLGVVPEVGVRMSISVDSAGVKGDWGFPMTDSGSFDVTVEAAYIDVVINIMRHKSGRPTASLSSCDADIGNMDLIFHGGASWLYNLFSPIIVQQLKTELDEMLCDAVNKSVHQKMDGGMASTPVIVPMVGDIFLDMRLVNDVVFGIGYLQTLVKGTARQNGTNPDAALQPRDLPNTNYTGAPRMVYYDVTEHFFKSIGQVFYQSGMLSAIIKASDVPVNSPIQLKPSDKVIGTVLPKVHLNASAPPKVSITEKGAVFSLAGRAVTFASDREGKLDRLFGVKVVSIYHCSKGGEEGK
uniref:Bactericidal permeability-increasing protein n=1 Tax=Branchiostoma floridae TaxID=7739 RepID=C3ZB31_BRAFL|eukprot:XP_002594057.1 hypothetical protein BRAFLDRAFT_68503 [Branchiostoma floridae]